MATPKSYRAAAMHFALAIMAFTVFLVLMVLSAPRDIWNQLRHAWKIIKERM